jgi:hypothetical protein
MTERRPRNSRPPRSELPIEEAPEGLPEELNGHAHNEERAPRCVPPESAAPVTAALSEAAAVRYRDGLHH